MDNAQAFFTTFDGDEVEVNAQVSRAYLGRSLCDVDITSVVVNGDDIPQQDWDEVYDAIPGGEAKIREVLTWDAT